MTNTEFLSLLDDALPLDAHGRLLHAKAVGLVDALDEVRQVADDADAFEYPGDLAGAVVLAVATA